MTSAGWVPEARLPGWSDQRDEAANAGAAPDLTAAEPVKLPHILIVQPDPDAETVEDLPVSVECPNRRHDPRADCASWFPCGCTADDPYEIADDPCPHSPTSEHKYFSCEGLCAPTDQCFVAGNDDLSDAAADSGIVAGPGRYEVGFEVEDETGLSLHRWRADR